MMLKSFFFSCLIQQKVSFRLQQQYFVHQSRTVDSSLDRSVIICKYIKPSTSLLQPKNIYSLTFIPLDSVRRDFS